MFRFPFFSKRPQRPADGGPADRENHDRHLLEKQQFEEVLKSFHATRVDDRLVVLDIFLSTEKHVTLSDLEAIVRKQGPVPFGRAFLQETMEMFCRFGFAQKMAFENLEPRYEHHHLGAHHDHFICTRCGDIQEFADDKLERIQMAIAREFRFHPLQHKMEIYGLCAKCMAGRDGAIPLGLAAIGEQVRIVQLLGERRTQARLLDMGLTVGTCLEVISNPPSGPFIVAVHDSRLAIDADIARNLLVAHVCRPPAG